MEGPTPVSALIHAATMVTAGVFLIIRCSPIFEYVDTVLLWITFIGALTAFFSATVGMLQNDIKRIIAYLTCSQLGYMIFACGLSAYSVSFFHLVNHGFFKALFFLSAGSVIHGFSDEQDLRRMGGLGKLFPLTYCMFIIGSLSLIKETFVLEDGMIFRFGAFLLLSAASEMEHSSCITLTTEGPRYAKFLSRSGLRISAFYESYDS